MRSTAMLGRPLSDIKPVTKFYSVQTIVSVIAPLKCKQTWEKLCILPRRFSSRSNFQLSRQEDKCFCHNGVRHPFCTKNSFSVNPNHERFWSLNPSSRQLLFLEESVSTPAHKLHLALSLLNRTLSWVLNLSWGDFLLSVVYKMGWKQQSLKIITF